jgi:hypothetical protein
MGLQVLHNGELQDTLSRVIHFPQNLAQGICPMPRSIRKDKSTNTGKSRVLRLQYVAGSLYILYVSHIILKNAEVLYYQ